MLTFGTPLYDLYEECNKTRGNHSIPSLAPDELIVFGLLTSPTRTLDLDGINDALIQIFLGLDEVLRVWYVLGQKSTASAPDEDNENDEGDEPRAPFENDNGLPDVAESEPFQGWHILEPAPQEINSTDEYATPIVHDEDPQTMAAKTSPHKITCLRQVVGNWVSNERMGFKT
ncbi:hypothetical protein BCR34DRAFT_607063 [Clohesyomyces aquaticus]|uniref:Uncharacterized protein n=1 Tax=Clohesyomyces aquaticus TaxID=1231657 RepID=A0A1Y1YKG2_9PLEO|nr:hypothetical protein BCR34DRAFT_607063 [Clohesyomyces aquaticus]